MKLRLTPTVRVSFGLIMLTLSIVLVADWLGLVPSEQTLQLEHRKKFSESLAVQFSSMAQTGDLTHIRTTLEAIVKRDDNIESAAFRSLVGDGSIEAGNHSKHWTLDEDGDYSTSDQVIVPIFRGDQRWGSVEVKFAKGNKPWYSIVSKDSFVTLILFVTLSGFILYLIFLRRVLRELDPSQVVPERVRTAFDALAEGVLILDEEGNIVLANSAFTKNTSVDPASIVGTRADHLNWSDYQSDAVTGHNELPWSRVIAAGKTLLGEKLTIHKDSTMERSYAVNCTPVHDEKQQVRGVITTFDDVTELEKKNEKLSKTLTRLKQTQADVNLKNKELQKLATRDPLTNCLNRRSFNEQFTPLFEQASLDNTSLICVMVDIDHFKRINDNYGHALGDKVIKFVAEVLGKQVRRGDLLGRYGGEEFCVILDGASLEDGRAVAERMREGIINGDPSVFTSALRITASFGLACIYDEPDSKDELVNKADKALYLAKESGRNKVMVWENKFDEPESATTDSQHQTGTDSPEPATAPIAGHFEPDTGVDAKERIKQLERIARDQVEQFDRYVALDPVTQLPVRNLFIDRVEQALLRAKRDGCVMAVLSLGLQNLHRINDTLGHESAQELLRQTASRLTAVLRGSDSISLISNSDTEATLSKLTEGEFGMLLPAVKDSESITWIVKRIFDVLKEPLFINDHNLTISSNVGVGIYPADGADAATLIRNASISRNYAEQQVGTNNIEYYSEDINRIARDQLHIESQMSDAVDNEEFEVLYQPIIDLATAQITGFEALLRWNHPIRGLLTPNEFIEIAERTRLINLIGDWVLRQACRQILEFSEACGRELTIAVNMSPVQFSQPSLVEHVLGTLLDTGMNPRNLELELTENCLMEDVDLTFKALTKLQSLGINISIDDFGTGYSGLSNLRRLAINILKVDRCFVADVATNAHDKAIVSAIVVMAKALDLKVIAEGVETPLQLEILQEMGCDRAQGYFFSRPVTAQQALDLLLAGDPLPGKIKNITASHPMKLVKAEA